MKLLIIINVLFSLLFFSCGKTDNHCSETAGVESSTVLVTFYSSTAAKYMYTNIPLYSLYNKDSLVITDQDGIKLNLLTTSDIDPNNPGTGYYIFGITPIYKTQTDVAAFNQEISKQFYIKYNRTERDTLTCIFKANKNECNSYFEYLKVYYRNTLIKTFVNNISGGVKINKP